MADLEIGEHVCKKQKVMQGAMDLWKQKKKIISIVVCDVIALRSRRKESLKHQIFSDFFRRQSTCVRFFFHHVGNKTY